MLAIGSEKSIRAIEMEFCRRKGSGFLGDVQGVGLISFGVYGCTLLISC